MSKHLLLFIFLFTELYSFIQSDLVFQKHTFNTTHSLSLHKDSTCSESSFSVTCTDHNTFGHNTKGKYKIDGDKLILFYSERTMWDSRRKTTPNYNDSIIKKDIYTIKKCNDIILLLSADPNYSEELKFKKDLKSKKKVDIEGYWRNIDIKSISKNNKYNCFF